MKIVNATHKMLSIMTDRGDLITVAPGKVSPLCVATKNLIVAAMNSGKPTEIGIVLGGSYEQGIAQQVTGCQPYCYLSEPEAVAKLLDPTVNYGQELKTTQTDDLKREIEVYKTDLQEERSRNEMLEHQIEELQNKIQVLESDGTNNLRIKQLQDELAAMKSEKVTIESELNGAQTDIKTHIATIQTLTADRNALQERVDILVSNNKTLTEQLEQEKAAHKATLDSMPKVNEAEVEEISKLKTALTEATEKIESMRDTFNGICDQFGITWDGTKWVQNPQSEE